MNRDPLSALMRAVLYEGYALYPYRKTALKNRQRWNFGVLFPPEYCLKKDPSERSMAQTECLFERSCNSSIEVTLRFLQQLGSESIMEREISTGQLGLENLLREPALVPFRFHDKIDGLLEITAIAARDQIFRVCARILNQSPFQEGSRDQALSGALISTHALLTVEAGRFHSMIDPPEELREPAAECRNIGLWPVLVGEEGAGAQMLACPIILYDYPKVADASPGDMFDATEIDEMLALRVRTLSERELAEMGAEAAPVRELLERTKELTPEVLSRLHACMGATRTSGCPYRKGDRVRLCPAGGADIFDLALAGRTAEVISVEQDFEGQFHLSVIIETDPGQDLGLQGWPGHRFFFRPDEVERL
jgi:hypothetical protein